MSTQIRYKGKAVATFNKGTVTLHTEDFGLAGDIDVVSDGGDSSGGGASVIVDGNALTIVAASVTMESSDTISIGG